MEVLKKRCHACEEVADLVAVRPQFQPGHPAAVAERGRCRAGDDFRLGEQVRPGAHLAEGAVARFMRFSTVRN